MLPAGDSFSIADIAAMPYLRLTMAAAGEAALVAKRPNVQVELLISLELFGLLVQCKFQMIIWLRGAIVRGEHLASACLQIGCGHLPHPLQT